MEEEGTRWAEETMEREGAKGEEGAMKGRDWLRKERRMDKDAREKTQERKGERYVWRQRDGERTKREDIP